MNTFLKAFRLYDRAQHSLTYFLQGQVNTSALPRKQPVTAAMTCPKFLDLAPVSSILLELFHTSLLDFFPSNSTSLFQFIIHNLPLSF